MTDIDRRVIGGALLLIMSMIVMLASQILGLKFSMEMQKNIDDLSISMKKWMSIEGEKL